MATLAFSTVTARVLPYVTGCPIPVVEIAIREAAIDFCERTHAWREDLTAINVVDGTSSYALAPAMPVATGEVVTPLVVKYDSAVLTPLDSITVRVMYPDHPDAVNKSPSQYYQFTEQQTINLVPVPDASITGGLEIFAAIRPLRSATGMDLAVLTKWGWVVEAGALHRLCVMPGKNWSNPKLAEFFGRRFMSGCNTTNAEARKGYTGRGLGVRMREYF